MTAAANNARSVTGTRLSTISLPHRTIMFGRNMSRFFIRLLSSRFAIDLLPFFSPASRLATDFLVNEYQRCAGLCKGAKSRGSPGITDSANLLAVSFPSILSENQFRHVALRILYECDRGRCDFKIEVRFGRRKQLEFRLACRLGH